MIFVLLLNLISSTEYVYLYTIKEGVILFVHKSIKDDYEINMELVNSDEPETISLLEKDGAERDYLIEKIDKALGLSCFNHEKYAIFATDPTSFKLNSLEFYFKRTGKSIFVEFNSYDLTGLSLINIKVEGLKRHSQFKALTETSDLLKAILIRLSNEATGNDKLTFSSLATEISNIDKKIEEAGRSFLVGDSDELEDSECAVPFERRLVQTCKRFSH